jgi:hypothetical protein
MTTETMAGEIVGLKEVYGEVSTAAGTPGQTLLQIGKVRLPGGCKPVETPALLVLQDGQRPVF